MGGIAATDNPPAHCSAAMMFVHSKMVAPLALVCLMQLQVQVAAEAIIDASGKQIHRPHEHHHHGHHNSKAAHSHEQNAVHQQREEISDAAPHHHGGVIADPVLSHVAAAVGKDPMLKHM